jgi:2-polyprenyl-6-methoxyphenol hydroxylase-like FAD-dependent oxidoreductase
MAEKLRERRAVVIGGSMAGLFVAAFLRRIGWRVDIYERSSVELIGRGVGIFATHLELLEALDKCGAGTVDIGVIVYKRITFDRKGNVIAEKPQLQIVTSWDRLRQVLLKAIDRQHYHFGYAFERVEQDGSGVHVYFANGRSERADLLVACDGFRSSVRAHLTPEARPIYSGCYIWRGAPNESDLSQETRSTMFPYYSFFLGDQLQALGYPISGMDDELRTGHRRYNFGWYRVASAADLKRMCVDDQGREYEFGVPPPLGVSKAGAEAQALGEALSSYDDIDRALAAYNSVRQPLSERIVSHGQKLGMQLGIGIATDEDRRFAQLLQSPSGILDWIAVPNFLAAGT